MFTWWLYHTYCCHFVFLLLKVISLDLRTNLLKGPGVKIKEGGTAHLRQGTTIFHIILLTSPLLFSFISYMPFCSFIVVLISLDSIVIGNLIYVICVCVCFMIQNPSQLNSPVRLHESKPVSQPTQQGYMIQNLSPNHPNKAAWFKTSISQQAQRQTSSMIQNPSLQTKQPKDATWFKTPFSQPG